MSRYLLIASVALLLFLPVEGFAIGVRGGGGARPAGGYRPAATPSFSPSRPVGGDLNLGGARPGLVPQNRPTTLPANRYDLTPGSRPGIDINRGNLDINRGSLDINRGNVNISNRPNINTRPVFSRPNFDYYHHWHNGWYHGCWNRWAYWPSVWVAGAVTPGWLDPPGQTFVYSNPYYVQQTTVAQPVYDYSQPLPPPPEAPPPESSAPPDAIKQFDAARAAFKQGDYKKALELDNRAISSMPSDAVLHEFRALTLFALGNYAEASATIYAVLAAGPGWDWDTLTSLYGNIADYTTQLRALEAFVRKNPNDAGAHFLLAYHYLILEDSDAAARQFDKVTQLAPNDKLSAQLVKALRQKAPEAKAGP